MNPKGVGNKAESMPVVIKNNDAQIIFANAPVILDFGATTEIGKMVKSSRGLALAEQGFFFGLNVSGNLNNGAEGYSQIFGYNANARTILTTRTATTATWASIAAGSLGEILTVGTGTGSAASAGDQALVRAGLSFSNTISQTVTASGSVTFDNAAIFAARLAETFASTDTQASSLGPQSVTVWTTTRKVYLARM